MAQSKNTPAPKTAAELRALIFDTPQLAGEVVETRWGQLWAQELTQGQRNEAVAAAQSDGQLDGSRMVAAFIAAGTFTAEGGEQLFTADDIPMLLALPTKDTDKLGNAILRLSGMENTDVKAAVEKAGKD